MQTLTLKQKTLIAEITKAAIWSIALPFVIFQTSGLPWMFAYLVIMGLFYNFVIEESGIVGMIISIAALAVVAFYALLAIVLFFGTVISVL